MSGPNDHTITRFKWRFDNFMSQVLQPTPGIQLESSFFPLKHLPASRFQLIMVPRPIDNLAISSLWLASKDLGGLKSLHMNIQFWLEHSNGVKGRKAELNATFNANTTCVGFNEYMSRFDLNAFDANRGKNGQVSFLCCKLVYKTPPNGSNVATVSALTQKFGSSVSISKPIPPAPVSKSIQSAPIPNAVSEKKFQVVEDEFRSNLWNLYREGIHDCILDVAGTKIKVLKGILMAHSPVFKQMLLPTIGERSIIPMNAPNAESVQVMIEWMYINKLNDASNVLEDVYFLAVKYQIPTLKENCIDSLISGLNKGNILARHVFALKKHEDRLMAATEYFIQHGLSEHATNA
jgi:hypothetical protein